MSVLYDFLRTVFFLMYDTKLSLHSFIYSTFSAASVSSFLFGLPKCGYTFVEASIGLTLVKANYVPPSFISRFMSDATVRQLTSLEGYQRVYDEVSKGAFNTDRFYINPHITPQQAAQRYINWIRGLVESGEKIFEVWERLRGYLLYRSPPPCAISCTRSNSLRWFLKRTRLFSE